MHNVWKELLRIRLLEKKHERTHTGENNKRAPAITQFFFGGEKEKGMTSLMLMWVASDQFLALLD